MEPSKPFAKIILDSISPIGHRLTTMEVKMHRFVLAEFNTHRVFSRNSASSRAIPVEKQIERVMNDPALPLVWASEQKGMQGGDSLEQPELKCSIDHWLDARNQAVRNAKNLIACGLHKSLVNRLLEPFMWHTAIVSSTEWDNFFAQRATPICSNCQGNGKFQTYIIPNLPDKICEICKGTGKDKSLAQPEIVALADSMREALNNSKPQELLEGQWHLPYVTGYDDDISRSRQEMKDCSVARCARVSYLTHDEEYDENKDIGLANKLKSANPPHMSPFEHVACADKNNIDEYTPANSDWDSYYQTGNFTGWSQYRHELFGR